MVNRIDRLYESGQVPPGKRPQKPKQVRREGEEEDTHLVRRENVAERIAPQLQDKVQISDEGREASRAERSKPAGERVSAETAAAVADTWYAAGYKLGRDAIESR